MAELVDALDSGSSRGNSVDVRVILAANSPFIIKKTKLIIEKFLSLNIYLKSSLFSIILIALLKEQNF